MSSNSENIDKSDMANFDGWVNTITGLNMLNKDKARGGKVYSVQLSQVEAEEFYAGDDLARKIVDRLPKDGMRKGIEFCNLEEDIESKLNDYCKKIDIYSKLLDAWIVARLYGGAGIFINFIEPRNGNDFSYLSKPVNESTIKGIKSLTVFNRYELSTSLSLNNDITSENFGLPEYYELNSQSGTSANLIRIHSSRIIRVNGAKLPSRLFQNNNYWDGSVLSSIFQNVSNYNQAYQTAATTLLDFRISIIRLKNLFEMVASGNEQKVKDRMELMKMQKSVLSMVLLNEGEDYENHTHSLAGIKDILDKLDNHLVAASGYPHTILLGESPSGMASTGNSELTDYYDHVGQEQNRVIRKPMNDIFKYIFLAKDGPTKGKYPDNFDFNFKSLWQLDDVERAKMELDIAKKDEVYIQNGVLDPDEVAMSRFGGKEFSLDTKLSENRLNDLINGNEGDMSEGEVSLETY